MDLIDELILDAVEARALAPIRLEPQLRASSERAAENRAALLTDLVRLRRRHSEADLTRHDEAIEKRVASLDKPILKQRIGELRLQASEAHTRIAGVETQSSCAPVALAQRISTEVCKRLCEGPAELRKTWPRHCVDKVDIHPDRIVIRGPKAAMTGTVSRNSDRLGPAVPSLVRKWRANQNKTANTYIIEIVR